MIMISKRLNSLTRKAIAATTIALSFAVMTPKAADAADFHLNFSSYMDGEQKSVGAGSFSIDEDGKVIDFKSTNSFVQGNIFTEENIYLGGFDTRANRFQNLRFENGAKLKLGRKSWRLENDGDVIKRGKYEITKKEPKAVPEPLTILASATALGIGGLLKKQHSKNLKKQELA